MSGWETIESDPGVFTELIERMGVKNVQVEEIWSLDEASLAELKPVYGLIFLFKWEKEHTSDDSGPSGGTLDYSATQNMFFAHQVINNACATQAILSILMNRQVDLGEPLSEFKAFSSDFPPDLKGEALSNSDLIREVHNSFARSDPFVSDESRPATKDDDLFHFIAYLPINGALYELDGLQNAPKNHGPASEDDWLSKAGSVIQARIARHASNEIRFNLMAVIKDRVSVYTEHMATASEGQKHLLQERIGQEKTKLARYKTENTLRKHNFIPFIYTLTRLMAEKGLLQPQIDSAKQKATERRGALQKKKAATLQDSKMQS